MYNTARSKEVIHISEADAASNFVSLLARFREGAEIVIEIGPAPWPTCAPRNQLARAAFSPSL